MFYIVLFLTAGFLVGYKLNLSDKIIKINGRIQTISLFALIFVMGMGIGSDKEVLKSIPAIGAKALVYSAFAVFFSVLAVYLFSFIIERKKGE
ncbi:lysine exporter LysO family protein [Anaerotignum faecicola]|nr:lysine exporter LysO family protein [Anaerotignum faecicola]